MRIFQEIRHPDAELIRAKLGGERVLEPACCTS
jgi:hypothetical protein